MDELCRGIVSDQDIQNSDQIDEMSMMENIMKYDHVQSMDSSILYPNPDFSFENRLETHLNLAERNKIIYEQESKLNKLDNLIEGLMSQILRYKLQEKRANC